MAQIPKIKNSQESRRGSIFPFLKMCTHVIDLPFTDFSCKNQCQKSLLHKILLFIKWKFKNRLNNPWGSKRRFLMTHEAQEKLSDSYKKSV